MAYATANGQKLNGRLVAIFFIVLYDLYISAVGIIFVQFANY